MTTTERPPSGGPRHSFLGAIIVVAMLAVVIVTIEPEASSNLRPDPIETVARFRDAFDTGSADALDATISADPSILTWPAGPPCGGPRKWTLELVPPTTGATLDHQAQLHDYVAFHQALHGRTELAGCASMEPLREPARSAYDYWVTCEFTTSNDLVEVLAPGSVGAEGRLRFGIVDDTVAAVLVEGWDDTLTVFDYLMWIRDARPDAYEEVLAGRVTVPNYTHAAAIQLLELARDFRDSA